MEDFGGRGVGLADDHRHAIVAAFADLLAKAKTYYANHQDTATAFNGNPEASAWAVVTRVFLNLDEFITRE